MNPRVDLPDPLTPVTTVSMPSGEVGIDVFKVVLGMLTRSMDTV